MTENISLANNFAGSDFVIQPLPSYKDDSIWFAISYCQDLDVCLIKYICGSVSLIFVILYGIAVERMRRKKTLDFDIKDKILLCIALTESSLILLYHIFYYELIFLFILRIAKMNEQITVCFILVELTTKAINQLKAFVFTIMILLLSILIVLVIHLGGVSEDFLGEQKLIWTLLSGL